ncbi:hypothetical protein Nepgr_007059 [Nepenthes gracilis]|uniref:RecA family profile 2 domain-containing protein n=1 Tax=Nepenthes gracilis TaxID=150966 RepID=A0AAD3XHZ9_NEPGR|nr:hypothetical protein Nepgr_007059 [Nepenthes gracilis]
MKTTLIQIIAQVVSITAPAATDSPSNFLHLLPSPLPQKQIHRLDEGEIVLWESTNAKVDHYRAIKDLWSCSCPAHNVLNSYGHAFLCGESSQRYDICFICRIPLPHIGNRLLLLEYFRRQNRKVVARALFLLRGVEEPDGKITYTVVLDGLCKISCKIGVYYGNLEVTSGGIALKFFASLCLEIRPMGKDKSVNGDEDIEATGSWYSYGDQKLGQGRDRVLRYLRENHPLCDEIEKDKLLIGVQRFKRSLSSSNRYCHCGLLEWIAHLLCGCVKSRLISSHPYLVRNLPPRFPSLSVAGIWFNHSFEVISGWHPCDTMFDSEGNSWI